MGRLGDLALRLRDGEIGKIKTFKHLDVIKKNKGMKERS